MNPAELVWSTWTEVFKKLYTSGELTVENAPRVCEEMQRNPFAGASQDIQDAIKYLESIKEMKKEQA